MKKTVINMLLVFSVIINMTILNTEQFSWMAKKTKENINYAHDLFAQTTRFSPKAALHSCISRHGASRSMLIGGATGIAIINALDSNTPHTLGCISQAMGSMRQKKTAYSLYVFMLSIQELCSPAKLQKAIPIACIFGGAKILYDGFKAGNKMPPGCLNKIAHHITATGSNIHDDIARLIHCNIKRVLYSCIALHEAPRAALIGGVCSLFTIHTFDAHAPHISTALYHTAKHVSQAKITATLQALASINQTVCSIPHIHKAIPIAITCGALCALYNGITSKPNRIPEQLDDFDSEAYMLKETYCWTQ
jgi:hypothetical protein